MRFSIGPKTHKRELYGFGHEVGELEAALRSAHRLVVIKGLRRTGKTSLMNAVYSGLKAPKIFVDAREVEAGGVSIYQKMSEQILRSLEHKDLLKKVISRIESVEAGVKIKMRTQEPILSALLEEMDRQAAQSGSHFYIFIDEAQLLKASKFDFFLALVFDRFPRIKTIVAGSQVGLLDEFVGEKAQAPLYGRARVVVNTQKLAKESSLEFLREGFVEEGKRPVSEELEEATAHLNGTIGWLNLYGFYALAEGHHKALVKVKREGAKIVWGEISSFLKGRETARDAYLSLLGMLALKPASWSQIRNYLVIKLGRNVPEPRLLNYLSALMDNGFVEKTSEAYVLSDPLIGEALKLAA